MEPTQYRKLGFFLVILLPVAPSVRAQDDDWEEDEQFVQLPLGLTARYETADGEAVLERMEPVPRLVGREGDAPHPIVPVDHFHVTWEGRLLVPYDGRYTFWFNRSSLFEVRFTLYGKPVRPGEPVELRFGNVPLELSGVHDGRQTQFELAWQNEMFAKEVLAPRFFGHLPAEKQAPAIVRQALEDSGAALAESFGCFRCHQGPESWTASLGTGVPAQVTLPGPRLAETGRRVHAAWLERYLTDPPAYRPGTRMPAQLTDSPADREALKTIVAYLASGQTAEIARARPTGSSEKGKELFDAAGCAACHEPPEETIAELGVPLRIPSLERLAEKWTVSGLIAFLQMPIGDRPHGRMPDFALSGTDARDLAAYLLTRQDAGVAAEFVEVPAPRQPVETDPRGLVNPAGNLLLMGLDQRSGRLFDRSGKNHHGTPRGRIAYGQPGRNDAALGFDGEGGHVLIDGSEQFNTNADFTWTAWIKTTEPGAILAHAPADGDWVRGGKTLFVREGKLCFDVGWVGVVGSNISVDDGRWHHVAVTAEFDTGADLDTVVLYVDGKPDELEEEWDIDQFPEENLALKIGFCTPSFPESAPFKGRIDEVTAWSRALDADEIAALCQHESHLAVTEASLFTPQELKDSWAALGEDAGDFERLPPGTRLRAVALREMTARGCINCHQVASEASLRTQRRLNGSPTFRVAAQPAPAPPLPDVPAERLAAGCLSASDSPAGAPRFDFSAEELGALRAYVASLKRRAQPSLLESLAIDMKLLNCVACHENDGYGGEPLEALLGGPEEAQFILPLPLSGVAARLRPGRLEEYLRDGTRYHRLRPWLGARMPGFGQRGRRVARHLCVRDRVSLPPPPGEQVEEETPAVPQSQIDMGRLLVTNKGLTCMNCHSMNGLQPEGEVDPSTRSADLGLVAAHLRPDYFQRLLRNPDRIFPGTKMPELIPKNTPPPVAGLEDVPEQLLVQALWSYLSLGQEAPEPLIGEPVEVLPDLMQIYVQRGPTYVGEELFGRGITCGFPGGTLLFDADALQPGAMWFDGFLNRVPTTYFGLNWRAPQGHELLLRAEHPLAYQAPGSRQWLTAPRPLQSDPNTGSRLDGYTVGKSEITLRYRLSFGDRRIPVSQSLRIDRRDAWRGLVSRLEVRDLPDGARAAWTVPRAERYDFFTAAGEPVSAPSDVAEAPVVVCWNEGQVRAFRAEVDSPATWLNQDGILRLAGPKSAGGKSVTMRIDRWTYVKPDAKPSAEQLASLSDPDKLKPPAPAAADSEERSQAGGGSPGTRPNQTDTAARSPRESSAEEPFSYRLESIPGPPEGWRPSGVCFTADGMVYACGLTEGRVYRAKAPAVPVPKDFRWQLYATGLNVATGMNAIGNRVFVAHRPEITELVDRDGDGTAEEFRSVCGPWSLKDGFHEYNFGLAVDPQDNLFVGLNNGYFWSYGGPTNRGRFRSYVLRCNPNGLCEPWGRGCRVPNGIACGPEGQPFYVDNQGDWIQVCKLVHCRPGLFYGHPETKEEFLPEGEVPSGLSAIWIPYNVIRSAAALCYDDTGGKFGPFSGQMFTGDCGYGQSVNIMRMALEKVDGEFQGAALRFIDGPPRGPQHAAFGPDGHLYICCLADGLVRVRYGGKLPMEIHHVNLRRDNKGFVLHFTKPIAPEVRLSPRSIRARRWWYPYGIRYGSPRYEEVDVPIEEVRLADDRKSIHVTLPIKTYKNGIVYYFNVGKLRSADGDVVEHPEAWYTVQRLWK